MQNPLKRMFKFLNKTRQTNDHLWYAYHEIVEDIELDGTIFYTPHDLETTFYGENPLPIISNIVMRKQTIIDHITDKLIMINKADYLAMINELPDDFTYENNVVLTSSKYNVTVVLFTYKK